MIINFVVKTYPELTTQELRRCKELTIAPTKYTDSSMGLALENSRRYPNVQQRYRMILGYHTDHIVGWSLLSRTAKWVVLQFYVDPNWRRRGIGRSLLEKSLVVADEGPWGTLTKVVLPHDDQSRGFFRNVCPELPNHFI